MKRARHYIMLAEVNGKTDYIASSSAEEMMIFALVTGCNTTSHLDCGHDGIKI